MVRSAQKLHSNIHATPERFKIVLSMKITPEQTDQVNAILFDKIDHRVADTRSLLEIEDAKDEILDWLEDRDIENADELAETFIEFNVTMDDLNRIEEIAGTEFLNPILQWIDGTLSKENLIREIQESAHRISELIQSIKAYSHMDRGDSPESISVHPGLINTMIMLKHKFKQKNISVDKAFDKTLPNILAHPGKLNQIWTNLIDNAIDAMDKGGKLTVRTYYDEVFVCVEVEDNGSGIPEDKLSRIFEPFFTTKAIGEGTGMGLDIVRRIIDDHKGLIDVQSQPGKTVFKICLPIQAK